MKLLIQNHKLIKVYRTFITLAIFILSAVSVIAQQGSEGNTFIFSGAEMTFFDTHNFDNGGNGALPGIVGTERSAPWGVLNFSSTATTHTGASDGAHVDGYVRKYGNDQFIFPTGDNGRYGPFAASASGTMGAYYYGNPSTAITSDLKGGDHTTLPIGGPFSTSLHVTALTNVSPIEYWDIDGTTATKITLTWDVTSAIGSLTSNDLNKLTIAGWDGNQWVNINSIVDPTSILGAVSDLTAGSITTTATIIPSSYTAYTFAALEKPLPVTLTTFMVNRESDSVQLSWSTTEETNSDLFDIQHSSEGNNWHSLGTVLANGDSKIEKQYSFTHTSPSFGVNYYRLKILDKDKTFAYSPVRSIVIDLHANSSMIYPNPAINQITIRDFERIQTLKIVDLTGKSLYQADLIKDARGVINLPALKHGLYMVITTDRSGKTSSQKLIIGQ